MSPRRRLFRPQVEAYEDRLCPSSTVVLPISAFLAQQGHDSVFTPPVRDQLSWSNSAFDPGTGIPTRDLLVDYTGQEAQFLLAHGINLHTTVTGFVTETPVGTSGLMEVTVNLEARNALTWVANIANIDFNQPNAVNTAPLELGYRAQELVDNPHLTPALSNVHLQLTWQQQAGSTLPDLARLNENFALYAPPGFNYERVDVQSWGTGTLRADTTVGTPGQTAIAFTSQVADLTSPNLPGTLGDGFWQEPVDVIPVASASTHVASLNGTLIISNTSDANNIVVVMPTANGGALVYSNLGSGKEVRSPSPPPLRTVQAPFDAYGSSIGQRTCYSTRCPHWPWGSPARYYGRAGYRDDYGGGSRTSYGHYNRADISALLPTPVGGRLTRADTRGKSARFPGGSCRNPYPPYYRAAFASSRILYPQPHRLPLRFAFPEGGLRAYHVPPT
jgi:hypothetical protein